MQIAGEEWSKNWVEKTNAKALRQGVQRCEMQGGDHWIWCRVRRGR